MGEAAPVCGLDYALPAGGVSLLKALLFRQVLEGHLDLNFKELDNEILRS